MITAVDTSVLLDVFFDDPRFGQASADALRQCLREGALQACPVVWAEVRAAFDDAATFERTLSTLGVGYAEFARETASSSGEIWQAYRRAGGKRERIMADFLIGAHAKRQCDRLLTRDAGFFRGYFGGLKIVEP
ncbi:MAG: type II toxin-antitoxin system VapC family toxin [Sulfurisoma sp.]|nr:type II toxin-antitoxin system VapC family toxin [Sulfurisoma sp.]